MKAIAIVVASFCLTGAALAQTTTPTTPVTPAPATCQAQATSQNLHGAAQTSFLKRCCLNQSQAQKLHGAAETSFINKCMKPPA